MSNRLTDLTALKANQAPTLELERYLAASSVESSLIHLVKLRVSQINGCAYCLAMHSRDLRREGAREDRLHVLPAWRETTWFTERERAALAWAEALTTLPNREVPDSVHQEASAVFSPEELADLTLATVTINGWNRISIAYQRPPVPFEIEPAPIGEDGHRVTA